MENCIIANCTDTGKTRSVNEDSMVTFDTPQNGRVVVVCDGMGGQNAGDVASQIAVTVIQDILTDNAFPTPESAITSSIIAANKAILNRAAKDPSLTGMGSTCVMVIVKDGLLYYGSVGDSRIYYIANGMIRQITKDQSYVQTLVDAGEITKEQAEHHVNKNEITNALGVESMTPPVVCQVPITPEPGSVCLLCSDGLSGMIHNNTILNTVMRKDKSLKERAEMLVAQANDAGGHDNITVQLIEWPANMKGAKGNGGLTGKKSNNNMLIGIVLFALALLCAGAVYWFMLKSESETEPKPQPSVIHKGAKKKSASSESNTKIVEDVTVVKTVVEKNKTSKPKNGNGIIKKQAQTKNTKNTIPGVTSDKPVPVENTPAVPAIVKKDMSKEKTAE